MINELLLIRQQTNKQKQGNQKPKTITSDSVPDWHLKRESPPTPPPPPLLMHDDSVAGGCPFQVTWNSTEIALTSRRNLRSPQLQISSHSSFLFELNHGLFCRRDQPCQEIWVEGGQCFKRFEHQTLKDRKK